MLIRTARDLAETINNQLRLDLTLRPWQLYEPASTAWWLVPSSEWPAYRHGKFLFSLSKDSPRKSLLGLNDPLIEPDKIFAGLNVEKGYGKVATEVDQTLRRRPSQIIDKNWLWFSLVDGDGPTRFSKVLKAASASATIHLYVVSSYVHDRESRIQPERDAVMFRCHAAGISAVLANRLPVNVLGGIERAKEFVTLAEQLRTVDDYHWVDVYVGTHVTKGDVDIKELYEHILAPFAEWVREAPLA